MTQRRMKRRWRILTGVSTTLLGLLGAVFAGAVIFQWSEDIEHVNASTQFSNPLFIPPILEHTARADEDGMLGDLLAQDPPADARLGLHLREASHEYFPGRSSEGMQINGLPIGPTIRAINGQDLRIDVYNGMSEDATVHWHGMLLPAAMDGGPHQVIMPGTTWRTGWQVDQPAASLWYHAHTHHQTAEHVYKGLVGMVIIDDPGGPDLPSDYGVNDIPLIVQDRHFVDERLEYRTKSGFSNGDTLLVNGVVGPVLEPGCEAIRFRILNGANAHRFDFAFEDGRSFHVIAGDSGYIPSPFRTDHILLAPGERAEIVADFHDCNAVRLISRGIQADVDPLTNLGMHLFNAAPDENRRFDVLDIRPRGAPGAAAQLPSHLADAPALDPDDAVEHRTFTLGSSKINGATFDPHRIDFTVTADTIEIWTIRNPSFSYHPFHVHGVHFQILERDGSRPPPHERGWKDTVNVAPDETVRIIMKTPHYADEANPFMFHCHILEHEDDGMMGQFVVAGTN